MNAQFIKNPILIIIAGPNGSGKTSITNKVLKHEWLEDCVYINPDNIAKEVFGDWNSRDAILQAANYATEIRNNCLADNKSFIFETVLSANDKIEFIKKAKLQGYFIRLFFVSTDSPAINASRIANRVMEGGHDVPISKIISRYSKSILNCSIAIQIADRAYVYDNSIDFADPKLLFRTKDAIITKQSHEINNWAIDIYELLKN